VRALTTTSRAGLHPGLWSGAGGKGAVDLPSDADGRSGERALRGPVRRGGCVPAPFSPRCQLRADGHHRRLQGTLRVRSSWWHAWKWHRCTPGRPRTTSSSPGSRRLSPPQLQQHRHQQETRAIVRAAGWRGKRTSTPEMKAERVRQRSSLEGPWDERNSARWTRPHPANHQKKSWPDHMREV
jgi:hypothetical protein